MDFLASSTSMPSIFGKQLIDGVGLQAAAVSDSVVDIFLGTHIDAQTGGGVLREFLFAIDAPQRRGQPGST